MVRSGVNGNTYDIHEIQFWLCDNDCLQNDSWYMIQIYRLCETAAVAYSGASSAAEAGVQVTVCRGDCVTPESG